MTWLLVFFGAAMLIALTPGANNLLGLHHGMSQGLGPALTGLLGRLAAFIVLIAAVAAGLGQLLAAWEPALVILKWIGVAYLFYLGVRILLASRGGGSERPVTEPARTPAPALARKEFLVAISNPKAVLIFTAFVPQFMDAGQGPFSVQIALLGAVYLVAEFVAGGAYIVAGSLVGTARMTARTRRNLDRGTGVALLGMAGVLAGSRS